MSTFSITPVTAGIRLSEAELFMDMHAKEVEKTRLVSNGYPEGYEERHLVETEYAGKWHIPAEERTRGDILYFPFEKGIVIIQRHWEHNGRNRKHIIVFTKIPSCCLEERVITLLTELTEKSHQFRKDLFRKNQGKLLGATLTEMLVAFA